MTALQKIKKFFTPSSTSAKEYRASFLGKSVQENKIIVLKTEHTEQSLERIVQESESNISYLTAERGIIQYALGAKAEVSESLDSFWLSHTNEKDFVQERADKSTLVCEQAKILREPKQRHDINIKEVSKRKSILLTSEIEQLATLKKRRAIHDRDLINLSKELPFGLDHRKGYGSIRGWIKVALVLASAGEGIIVWNSLKVMRSDLVLEGVTAFSVTLGLFTLSKAVVYCGSNANYLFWRELSEKEEESLTKEEVEMGLFDLAAVGLFIFGIYFTVLLGGMRIQFLSETGSKLNLMGVLFNFAAGPFMFIVTIVLSMMLSNPAGKLKEYYTKVLKQYRRVEKKIISLQKILAKKRTNFLTEATVIQHVYQDEYATRIDERNETLQTTLLEHTNNQNATLVLSRQAKLLLIHQIQALIWMSRGHMENKTNEHGYNWPELDLTRFLEEPVYQIPFNNSNVNSKNK